MADNINDLTSESTHNDCNAIIEGIRNHPEQTIVLLMEDYGGDTYILWKESAHFHPVDEAEDPQSVYGFTMICQGGGYCPVVERSLSLRDARDLFTQYMDNELFH